MTVAVQGALLPPAGKTRLVVSQETPTSWTVNHETDCRSALVRGLKEYLESMSTVTPGGRKIQFKKVVETWAEPEDPSEYPSAVVSPEGTGEYDASSFTPVLQVKDRLPAPDDTRSLLKLSEFTTNLILEVWTSDPRERQAFSAMLEDALNPVDFMHGFRLDLPFYYGQRAEYSLISSVYVDGEEDAIRRHRKLRFTLTGQISQVRVVGYPAAQPRAQLSAIGPNVIP